MSFVFIFIPPIVGFLSSLFCKYNISDDNLKPAFQPPNWVFQVVWNILYLLYGFCAYLALNNQFVDSNAIFLSIWFLNLLLNFSWTPIFACDDSLNRSKIALWVLIALIMTLLMLLTVTIIQYRSLSMTLCLIPYITWLFVAYSLNLEIIRLRNNAEHH